MPLIIQGITPWNVSLLHRFSRSNFPFCDNYHHYHNTKPPHIAEVTGRVRNGRVKHFAQVVIMKIKTKIFYLTGVEERLRSVIKPRFRFPMEGKMSWMRKSNNRPDSANTIVQPTLQFPSERITIIIISQSPHWVLGVDSEL